MAKSTRNPSRSKQQKPSRDFPLTWHRHAKQWVKKRKGTTYYFGADPDEAVAAYHHDWPYRLRDETPPPMGVEREGLTVGQLCNAFHAAKKAKLDEGRIVHRTFSELYSTCERVVEFFDRDSMVEDLTPADFRRLRSNLAKSLGPVALGNWIGRIRSIFLFGYKDGLLDHPVKFGADFEKPTRDDIEKAKAASGDDDCQTFTSAELRTILDEANGNVALHAMILLAVNAAYGASDLSRLRLTEIDITTCWARSRRGKTGAKRGAKLWPETVAAVKDYLEVRPTPKRDADADILFITRKGKRWLRESRGDDPTKWSSRTDLIGNRFSKVLRDLDINGRRGVYNLRHTTATIADEVGDRQAVQYLLGHRDGGMTANYVHKPPSDARMEAVADRVRGWLFGKVGEV